ncbi:helix-turn-helix domain-containing protein [Streptomyces wuyuanensis]|uniref:helix-turn-helix domain-containing protein n=1 Tax=Streptomyces wuyuanensis TaxID=1196353 RepID=UPI0034494DAF
MTTADRRQVRRICADQPLGDPRLRLLTTAEAADAVGVSPACIRQWRRRGHLRPVAEYRLSGALLYREVDVLRAERDRREARSSRSKGPESGAAGGTKERPILE